MRICILGGPRTGKTTRSIELARQLGCKPQHTDDLIGMLEWSAASDEVSRWFTSPGPWVIEGVATVRALRKWLAANPGKPCDEVVIMSQPVVPLTSGQRAMAKGHESVLREVFPELMRRGVRVSYR